MEKKNIKKYAATGLLAASLLTGTALEIHDVHVDHTKEICPITHIMNIIPNVSYLQLDTYLPTGVALHQWSEMEKDYLEKGIEDVQISYGKISEKVEETQITMPIAMKREDGSIIYAAPSGCYLTRDENGNLVCQKTIISTQDTGYGLTASWGELSYDNTNGILWENEEVLKVRK